MILSHRHRFIFARTTKVAGTSLEIALSKYCGPKDVLTDIAAEDERVRQALGFTGPQNYLKPLRKHALRELAGRLRSGRSPKQFFGHMPARDIRKAVGESVWKSYFKFSIVRNPFDFAVSRYFWSYRNASPSPQGFREYLLSENPKRLFKNRDITHIDGKNAMDFMIRYENFEADLAALGKSTGLPGDIHAIFREIGAKKQFRPRTASTAEMFAGFPEGVARIERDFREEIETFGYRAPAA